MTKQSGDAREPSLIDIEVLDLGPLYEQAVGHYLSLDPARLAWSAEKRKRLRIRTECRWGRINLDEDTTFLLNEKGDGPRQALGVVVKAYISLYAELVPAAGDPGFFESHPFCKVPIDREAAVTFRALGIVALDEFIRSKIPEMEAAYSTWLSVLRSARDRTRSRAKERLRSGVSA